MLASGTVPARAAGAPGAPAGGAAAPARGRGEGEEEEDEDAFYQRHRPTLLRELCGADAAERLRCRSEGGVGLLNQGATCYANSLLQALFYIPEFRLAVYRWRPEHDEKGGSRGGSGAGSAPSAASSQDRKPSRAIAVQLQRMFAQMQLSSTRAISTLPFTTACDFTGYGARVQQDVQEYCRVLFSALEEAAPSLFADAEKILAGRARSYVRCCEAGFAPGEAPESCREEKFLDLQVPIQDCSSLEEALQKLSQPETLSGENRWLCEDLGRKVDAVKGVEFLHLPSTLCIQLMRFAFDPLEMRESKVTSKLRIPFWIDLSFLRADAAGGPLEYELAAVCNHKGGTDDGHYQAFVREWGSFSGTDCGTGAMYAQWRHLNDAQTALVSTRGMTGNNISDVPTEVWDAGGADSSGFASDDAYFLIYRQVGVGQEFPVISDEEVPQPHRSEIEEENVKLALLRRMCAIRKKFIEVKIYTPTGASLLFQQRISQQFRSLMDRRTQMSEKAQPSACPGGCGFEITWHSTHCCALCRDSGGRSHGPKCDKKSSEEKVDQAGAVPCANGCGFIRTWHETHCCDACSVSDGTTHGARCQRLPLTDAHEPCRGSCGYARTWHATHCCAACKASGGKEHGQKCEQRWYLPELIEGAAELADETLHARVRVAERAPLAEVFDRAVEAFAAQAERAGHREDWSWASGLANSDGCGSWVRLRRFDAVAGEVGPPFDERALAAPAGDVFGRSEGMVRAAALLEVLGEDTPSLGGWGEDRCSITVCRWDPLAGCISLRPGDIQVFRFASCSSPSPLGPALEPEVPSEAEGGPEPARGADVPDGTVTVREVRAAVAGAWALPDPSALALVALTGAQAGAQLPEDVQTLQMCGVVPGDILIAEVKASDEASGPCGSPGAALGSVALYDQVASGTHVEEVWELQRRYTVLSASWRAPFMPHDGPAKLRWVCREGYGQHPWMADSKEQPAAQPTPPLVPPEGYFGCGWAVVEPPGDCDRDGWQYAFDFYEEDDAWRAEAGLYLCRRRLWRCTFVR